MMSVRDEMLIESYVEKSNGTVDDAWEHFVVLFELFELFDLHVHGGRNR